MATRIEINGKKIELHGDVRSPDFERLGSHTIIPLSQDTKIEVQDQDRRCQIRILHGDSLEINWRDYPHGDVIDVYDGECFEITDPSLEGGMSVQYWSNHFNDSPPQTDFESTVRFSDERRRRIEEGRINQEKLEVNQTTGFSIRRCK